jgi:chromatin structure-remodeling complex subunit RSC1/2
MPLSALQTAAIKEVIQVILAQTATRGKRQLAGMFMDLVDRQEWPQYYEVSPI